MYPDNTPTFYKLTQAEAKEATLSACGFFTPPTKALTPSQKSAIAEFPKLADVSAFVDSNSEIDAAKFAKPGGGVELYGGMHEQIRVGCR